MHKHIARAGVDDRVDRRAEGHGARDDLVARSDPRGEDREVQRGGARAHGDRSVDAFVGGERALEGLDARTRPDPAAGETRGDLLDLGVLEARPAEDQRRLFVSRHRPSS